MEGKEFLGMQFNVQDYMFNLEAYDVFFEVVECCYQLFKKIYIICSLLGKFSLGLFLRMEEEDVRMFVEIQVW